LKPLGHAGVNGVVFLTSFSILSYEIVFTQVFAYMQWHNLSALVITMALMGFGASGSVVSIFHQRIEKAYAACFFGATLLFPVCLGAGFIISSRLMFNPYEIGVAPRQVIFFLLYFFLMALPFFLGGVIVCIAFLRYSISKTYFANLVGSGAGALAVMGGAYLLHPYHIMAAVIGVSTFPAMVISFHGKIKVVCLTGAVVVFNLAVLVTVVLFPQFKQVSPYKSISGALNLPEADIVHEAYCPLAVVQVVQAKGLRSTAGLSLVSPFQVPVQKGIFLNADSMSPITPFRGNPDDIRYLEYLTSYLPFYIKDETSRNRVLIIGSGGGESILKAVLSNYKQIDAVEVNPRVISLMKNQFADFSGNIYNRANVQVFHHDARSFIKETKEHYDLIDLSMIDGYNAAASGVYALNESYLYTIESIREYFCHLSDTGLLAISRWVVTPARDNLKLFNMVITALRQAGIKDVKQHLIVIRSLQTVTLLISKTPVPPKMIARSRTFAGTRLFDLVHIPGIRETDVNQFVKLETPVYYHALQALFAPSAHSFIDRYDFDISAPTDNRPYFYNFFKPGVVRYILTYGPAQMPVTEWGYLILLIILVPVVVISFAFILLPVLNRHKKAKGMRKIIFFYFSLIAVGYFFIEMPLIQKMVLFLGHPSYSIAVIIAGLLIFTGIGSLFSDRLFSTDNRILLSTVFICLITLFYLWFIDRLFSWFMMFPVSEKVLVVLFMVAPLGFFMGIPFPQGLTAIKKIETDAVSWAWGVNGFFSVISILLATVFAVTMGFTAVFAIACLCYLAAGILSLGFRKLR
jgi:SAM-dependent methyltransferase